ncbi:LysR family transcriptional regulator [Arthrobacter sp. NPDC090010]|uniref:LysR family transcriptional regulator n=1 Tax=Arthrobacter sp. NPDC090010 TaxID=3363942 RepID=UPI0038067969
MDSRIELKHLRAFSVLGEELHFSGAAAELRVAQPALSQWIRHLERELGVRLFERTSRSVRLSDAGAVFLPRVRELLDRLERDVEEVRRVDRGEAGTLDLGFITSAGVVVSDRLKDFAALRPDVNVRLSTGDTTQMLERLRRGSCDIGVVRDAEHETGIELHSLRWEDFVAVLPHTHRAVGRRTVTAEQLREDPLILFPRASGPRAYEVNMKPFRDAGDDRRPDQECTGWHTVLQLVSRGLGVTIAPRSATEELPDGAVVVELDGPVPYRSEVQLAVREGDRRPVVEAFLRAAAESSPAGFE